MKLTKWSPTLDIGVESPVIPIWISFPRLRPHFFSPRILYGLGGLFGKPLKIDEATAIGSRPSIARVLVELDITKSYPKQVWLGSENQGYTQEVVFDEFPNFCAGCKSIGHSIENCRPFAPISQISIPPPNVNVISEKTGEGDIMNSGLNHVNCNDVQTTVVEGSSVLQKKVNGEVVSVNDGRDPSTLYRTVENSNTILDVVSAPVALGVINETFPSLVNLGAGGISSEFCSVAFSPNARPFLPHAVASDSNVILAPVSTGNFINAVGGDVMTETGVVGSVLNEAPSLQKVFLDAQAIALGTKVVSVAGNDGSPVLDIVNSNGNVHVLENEEGGADVIVSVAVDMAREEGIPIENNLVEVPVNVVDTHKMANCVGNPAGMEIRNQKNWLIDLSDDDSYSEFYDSDNDLSLVRSSNVANRGKFWGRGRRKR
ncbi:hypothetical protein KFK09_000654 [Dendrobium nobile]|uniref:DUF4283 domain-containing protein n=1 Tax=Dendrobium nobile TaxID=94219 RepID=A0A8T3CCI0_DENNO|nr:hypothetical protein KFK09_000654 [Dendrobium nobile]